MPLGKTYLRSFCSHLNMSWNEEVESEEFANEKMAEGGREAPQNGSPSENPTQLAQVATEIGCKVWGGEYLLLAGFSEVLAAVFLCWNFKLASVLLPTFVLLILFNNLYIYIYIYIYIHTHTQK